MCCLSRDFSTKFLLRLVLLVKQDFTHNTYSTITILACEWLKKAHSLDVTLTLGVAPKDYVAVVLA